MGDPAITDAAAADLCTSGGCLEWSVASSDAELAACQLWDLGASAIEERRCATAMLLIAGFDDLEGLNEALSLIPDAVRHAEVAEWLDTWKAHATPYCVAGQLTIVPAWCDLPDGVCGHVVRIDPGSSFGLLHVTTQLGLEALIAAVQPASSVLDVGSGSGILSIAAARLGAVRVCAIDIESTAVVDTGRNALLNGVAHIVDAHQRPIASIVDEFDVVVANLGGAEVLVAMAEDLRRVTRVGGQLVLGGLLDVNLDVCLAAFEWATEVSREHRDGWNVIVMAPR